MLPQAIDAFFGQRSPPALPPLASGSVTLVVHVKDEPPEISRIAIMAAAASAPTVVITTDLRMVELLELGAVPVFIGTTIEAAMNEAAQAIDTDAVLLLSARAFANLPAVRLAAGLIAQGSGWVIGRCSTFNDDGFAPLVRERLRQRLRSSARASDVELWEPNATVVSTTLVRDRPFEVGRPWGTSMRSWAAAGAHGDECDLTVAMSAEPTNVRAYWPMSIRRRRGAVADTADAVRSQRGRRRWLALGLLLRELIGYPLTLALLTPWLLTEAHEFPFTCSLWTILLLWLTPTIASSYAERRSYGIGIHPLEDALALAFDAPASVLALPAALSRRVRPTRFPLPGRPLMVAAFAFAAFSLVPLLTRGTTTERAPSVGLALTELALLWMLAMRAVFQRNWANRTYRIRCRLPVEIHGIEATTFDVSPTGLSFEHRCTDQLPIGAKTSLMLRLDDGSDLSAQCTVLDRRPRGDRQVTGVLLQLGASEEGRWISQLARAAISAPSATTSAVHPHSEPTTWPARVLIASTIAVSAMVVATLGVTLIGYRPLIVRSGSMKPALDIGDVVFVEEVDAAQLVVGDIATIEAKGDESLTHRVRAVERHAGTVTITTRGDANPTAETITVADHAQTGRVVAHIPRIGRAIAWTGASTVRRAAATAALAYVAVAIFIARRHRPRP